MSTDTTTTAITPIVNPKWVRTGKGIQTWYSPIGRVDVFKKGAYWYYEGIGRVVGPQKSPQQNGASLTAAMAKRSAERWVEWVVERRVNAHTPTPAFPFVVGQRVSCNFGTATVIKADRPGWIELVWDNGTDTTGEEFDASEFIPA